MSEVVNIFCTPIYGTAPVPLAKAEVVPGGLRHHCEWALINRQNKMLTRAEVPALASIQAYPVRNGLNLAVDGVGDNFLINLLTEVKEPFPVEFGKGTVLVTDVGKEAGNVLSEILQTPCRLVHFYDGYSQTQRSNHSSYHNFNDGPSLYAIGTASVTELGRQPEVNLVIDLAISREEQHLPFLRIGNVHFVPVPPHPDCGAFFKHKTTGTISVGQYADVGQELSTVGACP